MAIEDILAKAHHKDIMEHGTHIQESIDGMRLELLAKHYATSLPDDKKKEWEGLNEMERNIRLAQNDYKLPQDQAEAFLMDIAYNVLHGTAPEKAKEMKKQMGILKNPSSTPEQKRDAHKEIDHFMAIINSYGIRMDTLNEGKEKGFGADLFRNAVRNYGEMYKAKEQSYWLDQIDNDMADEYLSKFKEHELLKDFDYELMKKTPVQHKREIISGHYMGGKGEKEGALEVFKKSFDKYFKKLEE